MKKLLLVLLSITIIFTLASCDFSAILGRVDETAVWKNKRGELAKKINFRVPDEKFKRHGQAVIAATL